MSPDALFLADEQGRVLDANQAASELHGFTHAELLTMTVHSLAASDLREEAGARLRDAVTRGLTFEWRQRRKDGTEFPVEIAARPIDLGGRRCAFATVRDISGRRLAEQALREREAMLKSIFAAAPAGIGVVVDRVIREANDTLCRMTGYSREDLIGRSARLLYPTQEEFEAVGRDKYAQIKARGTGSVETRWQRGDGSIIHVLLSSTPLNQTDLSQGVTFTALDITERKRMEEALRESEERFRGLFASSRAVMLLVEPESGRILDANDAAEKFYGYPLSTMRQMLVTDINVLPPEEVRARRAEATRGKSSRFVFPHRLADGSLRTVEVHSSPVSVSGTTLLFSIVHDITARVEAESALRESEERLRTLINAMPDIVCFKDGEGRWLVANDFDLRLFELEGVDYQGKKDSDLAVHSDFYRDAFLACEESDEIAWKARTASRGVEVIPRPNGPGFAFDIIKVPTFHPDGRRKGLVVVGRDITELKEAEEALRAKSEELDRYFTTALDLFCIASLDAQFIRLNSQWEATLGYRLEDLEGHCFLDFIHPEDVPATLEAVSHLGQGGEVLDFVNRYRCKDGSYRWIEWRSTTAGGRVFAAARDVTERKETEQHRLEMERRLLHAQKLESLGVLAGGIAHDFNNLLTAVLGNLELAQGEISPVSAAVSSIEEAVRAARRAADLTRQMLAYSGQGRFLVSEMNLSDLVEENAHMLRAAISKTTTLSVQAPREIPPIKADPGQIQQVVMNLITNASEALEDRPGIVTLRTGAMECTAEDLLANWIQSDVRPGHFVWLEVADTGCGMDEKTRSRLFDPFYTTKFQGRGLGMAAVSGIVAGHQGAIFVESEVGHGTRIRVLFPTASESDRVAKPPLPLPEEKALHQAAGAILVVDDEDLVRELSVRALTRRGYTALSAANGEEAVALFREHAPEIACVLLDLTMPRMDGIKAMEAMRQVRPDVRIILCSGFNEHETLNRITGKPPAGFIHKPYRIDELLSELKRILAGADTRPEGKES